MADVTRRDAVRLVAAGAAVAVGAAAMAADDKPGPKGGKGQVTVYSRIKIASKNVLGHEAALWFIEENGEFFLELTYRNRAARVKLADGEQEIANWFGIKFVVRVSDISRDGDVLQFKVKLVAETPFGDVTIIEDTVRIDIGALKADTDDNKKPVVTFGAGRRDKK